MFDLQGALGIWRSAITTGGQDSSSPSIISNSEATVAVTNSGSVHQRIAGNFSLRELRSTTRAASDSATMSLHFRTQIQYLSKEPYYKGLLHFRLRVPEFQMCT